MKKIRRSLVLLLLLIFSLVELRQGATGAQPINVSASTTRSIYLIAKDSGSPTHCVIVQMTENKDGTLSKSSEYDGVLPGNCTNTFYCRSNGHLYLNLANGSKVNKMIAQFEFRKDGRIYPATPFTIPGIGNFSSVANVSNGHLVSLDLSTGVLSLVSVDASSDGLRLQTTMNLYSYFPNKPTAKDAPNEINSIFAGIIADDSSNSFFYVSKIDPLDPTTDSILQFQLTSAGKILPLNPPEIKAECGFLYANDSFHHVLYSFLLNGDLRAFSITPNGQLKALMKEPTVQPEDNPETPNGAAADGNLIRIYPVPPPPAPPIIVRNLTLDPRHNFLFGLGGINGNEIYIWSTSINGPKKLVRRYWYDQFGDLKNADSRAGDNKNGLVGLTFSRILVVSSDGQYLYLFIEPLPARLGGPQPAAVFSYRVTPSGEMQISSRKACRGIDLTKQSLVSPFTLVGAP